MYTPHIEPAVACSHHDGVATITLAHPDSHNAFNAVLCKGLLEAAHMAAADASLRLVFVRIGVGAFRDGEGSADELHAVDERPAQLQRLRWLLACEALERLQMPVVALVEGAASGAGLEIVTSCDLAIATPSASFSACMAPEGTVQRLACTVGQRLAYDMLLSGRRLNAEEAHAAGLVTRVVASEALADEAAALVQSVLNAAPLGLRRIKHRIRRSVRSACDGSTVADERLDLERALAGADWRTGIEAFWLTR